MKLEQPINIKVFFRKLPEDKQNLTYNHYGVIESEKDGNILKIKKENGDEAIINMDNVNQIITL